jgi:hypothetical protein
MWLAGEPYLKACNPVLRLRLCGTRRLPRLLQLGVLLTDLVQHAQFTRSKCVLFTSSPACRPDCAGCPEGRSAPDLASWAAVAAAGAL